MNKNLYQKKNYPKTLKKEYKIIFIESIDYCKNYFDEINSLFYKGKDKTVYKMLHIVKKLETFIEQIAVFE